MVTHHSPTIHIPTMSPSIPPSELHTIQNTTINTAPSITLTPLQKKHVGLVLDMFQAKGTMAKIEDGMSEDAVYEDLFASCKNRREVAGQFLGLPLVTTSSITNSHLVTSITPSKSTTRGNNIPTTADEISIKFNHKFTFKLLPTPVTMDSTLLVYSDPGEGKIVRLQDRTMEEIPGNSVLTMMRKFNALAAPALTVPTNEKQDAEMMEKHQR